jgi:hypothetical protein
LFPVLRPEAEKSATAETAPSGGESGDKSVAEKKPS